MPKAQKDKMSTKIGQSTKDAPLGQVIQDDINRNKYATRKISGMAFSRRMNDNSDDDDGMEGEEGEEEEMLDEKTSRKIIDMGLEQQREVMEEDATKQRVVDDGGSGMSSSKKKKSSRLKNNDDSSDDDSDNNEEEDDDELVVEHDNSGYVNISSTNIGLTPEEEALLSNMMGNNTKSSSSGGMNDEEEEPQRRNLADIIMAKIEEKEAMAHAKQQYGGNDVNVEEIEEIGIDLPPKVVQVSISFVSMCMCLVYVGSY